MADQNIDQEFEKKIIEHEYHNELIVSEFPQHLEIRKKLTGCYIGNLDFSVKEINDDEEDEKSHLNEVDGKFINYIGFSKSHEFMKGKKLGLEQGITAEVFKEAAPEEVDPNADPNAVPVAKPTYIYVSDLVKQPKMYYFKWPQLGAYIAIPLVYQSCLSEASFDAGLEGRVKFNQAVQ